MFAIPSRRKTEIAILTGYLDVELAKIWISGYLVKKFW